MVNIKRTTITMLGLALCLLIGLVLLTTAPLVLADQPAGTGPESARVADNAWHPLNPGEEQWYAYYYAGDGSPVEVRLQVVPDEGATFAVWTPEQIRRRGVGDEVQPVGRGSPDPSAAGSYTWSGSFNTPGTYYLVVDYAGKGPGTSYYYLDVRGDGVSLSAPSPATSSKPSPPKPQTKPAAPSAPAGRLVFQTTFGGDFYTIQVNGENLRRITDGTDAIWSPDGKQIAFARWRDPRGIWVVNADGADEPGAERRVFDWDRARWPSWSPDGSEVMFSRMTGTGRQDETEFHPHWRLGVVRLDDGSFREPPSSEVSHAPMWSPDGTRVVYDDVQGLRIQSLDGQVFYLITHDARDTAPVWSPDGDRVTFVRRQHDHWEIYIVDADGRNLRRLTDTPRKPNGKVGSSAAPAWSPDGGHIAFFTDRSGKWEIWVMRAGGREQKPMFQGELDGLPLEYSSVSERAISWTR
jgi:TolB protein